MTKQSLRLCTVVAGLSLGMLAHPTIGNAGTTHSIEQKGKAKGHDKDKNKDKDKGPKAKAAKPGTDRTDRNDRNERGEGDDRDNRNDRNDRNDRVDTNRVVVVDRDGHQRIVREYVTRGNLPPGLAKRRTLPPGLARQLRENGELPPGLQTYFTPVPQDIDVRFPVLPAYYHRYFAGNDFVVVDTRTNRVALLIRDLLQ